MIILSSSFVLTRDATDDDFDKPIIGYRTQAIFGSVTADYEAAGYPASNLTNPFTNSKWVSSSGAEQFVTVSCNGLDPIDYVGLATHNLGTAHVAVAVEGYTELDSDGAPDWEELIEERLFADDSPLIVRFEPQPFVAIRLRLRPATSTLPTIAVLYVGKLLSIERRVYVGHTPITYGRSTVITNARSEAGDFLGRIVQSQRTESALKLQNLSPSWYRSNMEPFLRASVDAPFFFAWRPDTFPREVGYCWLTNDPTPTNQRPNGMMQIELQLAGVI